MTASSVRGRPMWVELMTTDMNAAEAFYKSVVGWTTAPFEGAGLPYSMWNRPDGVPVGGVMTLPDDLKAHQVPPHWMEYVGVEKLEDGVAEVQRLGGSTVSPVIEVKDVGRMQVVKDPQGAAFYLFEPASPPGTPDGVPVPGDVSWLELYTTDSLGAMRFYGDLFGWQPTETMDMGPMGVYRMFGRRSDRPIGGMMAKTPDMAHIPNSWLPYFLVPDIQAAAERIKTNGGRVVMGPMEVPGGSWILQGQDPQGGSFALHQQKN